MASAAPRTDRLRPFRGAAYALHTAVVVAFCLIVIWNVVRSVRAMTPARARAGSEQLSVEACADAAERLFQQLDLHRRSLSDSPGSAARADAAWNAFRLQWLQQFRATEARCRAPGRAELASVLDDLEWLEGLHTTHAVQYAGELGPTIQRFQQRLATVRGQRAGSSTE